MYCVDVIKEELVATRTAIGTLKKIDSIDSFLDKILYVRRIIEEATARVDKVYDSMYSFAPQINYSIWNEMGLKKEYSSLLKSLVQLYNTCRKCAIYSGIKTIVSEYKNSMDSLKELYNDIEVFRIQLPSDKEYKHLISRINAI